jgi:flavin-dependent dehydrogenase
VALLHDLGLAGDGPPPVADGEGATPRGALGMLGALGAADMEVVGPSGRAVRLPCYPGRTYPGSGWAVPRYRLDHALHEAALEAGAVSVTGRVDRVRRDAGVVDGVDLDDGRRLRATMVVGAYGATSRVAETAGLVDPDRVLWGFAVRSYLDEPVELPVIVLWEPEVGRGFPGYGWLFPGPEGRANLGLGIGTRADRRAGAVAVRHLPAFVAHLRRRGLLKGADGHFPPAPRLGGWLKMGMVGTTVASGGVLLVGDAAGLVNPLQGEGIAPALASGLAAAEAILAGPDRAPTRYRAAMAGAHLRYHRVAAAAHAALVGRPRVAAMVGRALTLPSVGRTVAGGWSLFWNDLIDGAYPGRARATASVALAAGRTATRFTVEARWLDQVWRPGGAAVGDGGVERGPVSRRWARDSQEAAGSEVGRQREQGR